jgi:DNA-directed RNA polymerase subunit K/omega
MLSDPNINKISPIVGNRYESALALSRRARDIENRRVIEGDSCIKDAVDIASKEIAEGRVYVKKSGVYVIEPKPLENSVNDVEENQEENLDNIQNEENQEDENGKKAKKAKKEKVPKKKKE